MYVVLAKLTTLSAITTSALAFAPSCAPPVAFNKVTLNTRSCWSVGFCTICTRTVLFVSPSANTSNPFVRA